ncbi:MAG: translation initiation factor IF-2 [Ignavibacteria bacterium GWA2_35_9]|nr:MAG: translation initiation factor IF-2 [Ignavibacteria bacterium GWA2_35_9]OGU50144.1 MAG: translation initiation factor IF-2 [Ignavibacteria bacterium GWC2_36_12]
MPEAKAKKPRIYKLASEYNLSAENLVDFLRGKGHDVKSHMSMLDDEMIKDINDHFKKEIEKAEKHYKKIAEFNKKRTEKAEQDAEEKSVKIEETNIEVPAEEILVQTKVEEKVKGEIEIPVGQAEVVEVAQTEEKNFKTPKEVEADKRKGLRVVGKIDLGKSEEGTDKGKVRPAVKKKKKPKAKKKPTETLAEETVVAKKRKRVKKFEIDEKEVKEAIRKTLLSMDDSVMAGRALQRKKKRKEREAEQEKQLELKSLEQNKIKVNEYIAVNELANLMNVPVADVISKCIELGLMVSINQRLDLDTITLVADEFGFEVEIQEEYTSDVLEDLPDKPELLKPRPPVITIMGHVDHGKTSLLDYIRRTNVVAGEAGGITQHIGAYRVDIGNNKFITFLDTPGHEAFTAMRARGAQLTDIVVIVVAADDAVMPQTVEAINHAQAASVPMVIAINKIDKPGANTEKIKQQLADRNILVEEWGGKFQCVEISAKSGKNVDSLLEKLLLEAELLDLKANPDREARGAVVESELDKGRGITGTILVQKGTLKIGDSFVAGVYHGKVRAMFDERGNKVIDAEPSTPVLVLGFEGAPQAGDTFIVVESEREARDISVRRQQLKREQDQKQVRHITLDEIAKRITIGGVKELALIVKGDVDGSVEALADSLMKITNEEVIVRVIHKGVGGISESDVLLASASDAIIIGFHVRPNINARKLAESQKVDIRLYNVIYDAINEVKSALEGLLSPVITEEVVATLEVRDTFKVPKSGTVAGCYVLEGKISRNNKIRLIRDGIVVQEGEIGSLRRFKDDVREVDSGYECGLNIANYNDIKVGDMIEAYKFIETKKKLA